MKHHHERVGFYKDNRDYGHLLSSSGGGGGGAHYGGGYSDDDADEAEEQEEEEEEMEEEEEEEEEEEDSDQVAKKAAEEESLSRMQQEYLERRQKLKEMERQRIKKKLWQNPGSRTSLQVPIVLADKSENRDKKRRLPYENYGSFFGPSQTIVAKRVIEEARAKEEADRARARLAREAEAKEAEETQPKSASKARPDEYRTSSGLKVADVPKQVNERGLKLQRLKEARDYSFLFTDEDPTASVPKAKSESVTKPEKERPPQVLKTTLQKKSAVPIKSNTAARYEGKSKGGAPPKVNSGQDKKVALVKKKPVIAPPNSKSPGPKLHSSVSTANSKVVNGVKAPSQAPIQKKAAPSASVLHGDKLKKDPVRAAISSHSKVTASTSQKAAIVRSTEHKKPHASQLSERRPSTVHSRVEPKRPMPTDLVKKKPSQAKPLSVHEKFKSSAKDRRRPVESDSEGSFLDDDDIDDGGNVSSLIRKMFRYNPNKYRDLDDQDDRDMEVGFSRIQAEESRSARIAKKEDEQELALIEEEERRERMRRDAKKRKLSRK